MHKLLHHLRSLFKLVLTFLHKLFQEYDPNAVKVVDLENRLIGFIDKEESENLSSSMLRIDDSFRLEGYQLKVRGTIISPGNGYTQSVMAEFTKQSAAVASTGDNLQTDHAKGPPAFTQTAVEPQAPSYEPNIQASLTSKQNTVHNRAINPYKKQQLKRRENGPSSYRVSSNSEHKTVPTQKKQIVKNASKPQKRRNMNEDLNPAQNRKPCIKAVPDDSVYGDM